MDINQSESGKRWVLICAICSKYTAIFLLKSSLMEQSIKVPTEIIQLCKLARKIQSREELIKIIACYYFNINSLFCHSYRCMPAGPWNEVMGWTGRACCWAESPREEAAYHRLSTHPCLRGRSSRDLDSEWSIGKYDPNLHLPCISLPLAGGSPLSVFCWGGNSFWLLSWAPLLVGRTWGSHCGAWDPLLSCWGSPWSFYRSKGGILWKATCQSSDWGHLLLSQRLQ